MVCMTACGDATETVAMARTCPPSPTGALTLDEHAATVRGIRIGDRRTTVLRRLRGAHGVWSTGSSAALSHCGAGFVGAVWVPERYRALRLNDLVIMFGGRPAKVYAFNLVGRGAHTAAGVGIGDPLDDVKKAYGSGGLRCTTIAGDDGPLWPACFVRAGPRFLYFGGDPIAEVALQPPIDHAPPARPGDRS